MCTFLAWLTLVLLLTYLAAYCKILAYLHFVALFACRIRAALLALHLAINHLYRYN